jgi:hypothetical protein
MAGAEARPTDRPKHILMYGLLGQMVPPRLRTSKQKIQAPGSASASGAGVPARHAEGGRGGPPH